MEPPDEVLELDHLRRYRAQLPQLEKGIDPPGPAPERLHRPLLCGNSRDHVRPATYLLFGAPLNRLPRSRLTVTFADDHAQPATESVDVSPRAVRLTRG
jgi:hypothetical protein